MSHNSSTTAPPLKQIPFGVHCAQDYEILARDFLPPSHYEYISGGSGRDVTAAANLAAFERWAVVPRLLRDVTDGHTHSMLAGHPFAHPLLLAPVAFQKLAHPMGELETARAARATDTCMVSSTLSSFRLEEIAGAASERWFQLYFQPQREATLGLLRRAEEAGYGAIVVTLDAAIQAASARALRAGFHMPADCVPVNLDGDVPTPPATVSAEKSRIFQGVMKHAPVWSDLEWLMTQTKLPLWVKGVMHSQDAIALRDVGVAGIVVSNHGGRGLDGAPATLQVLPMIRAALGATFPVLLDGGIRSGTDVFKALALGADAVLLGRLQLYALSVAGALGVAHMIKMLREELEVCMALAGCASLADISADALMPSLAAAR